MRTVSGRLRLSPGRLLAATRPWWMTGSSYSRASAAGTPRPGGRRARPRPPYPSGCGTRDRWPCGRRPYRLMPAAAAACWRAGVLQHLEEHLPPLGREAVGDHRRFLKNGLRCDRVVSGAGRHVPPCGSTTCRGIDPRINDQRVRSVSVPPRARGHNGPGPALSATASLLVRSSFLDSHRDCHGRRL